MDDLQACYSSQGAEATVANFIMTGCTDQVTCINLCMFMMKWLLKSSNLKDKQRHV